MRHQGVSSLFLRFGAVFLLSVLLGLVGTLYAGSAHAACQNLHGSWSCSNCPSIASCENTGCVAVSINGQFECAGISGPGPDLFEVAFDGLRLANMRTVLRVRAAAPLGSSWTGTVSFYAEDGSEISESALLSLGASTELDLDLLFDGAAESFASFQLRMQATIASSDEEDSLIPTVIQMGMRGQPGTQRRPTFVSQLAPSRNLQSHDLDALREIGNKLDALVLPESP